jgi:hypothetical protein
MSKIEGAFKRQRVLRAALEMVPDAAGTRQGPSPRDVAWLCALLCGSRRLYAISHGDRTAGQRSAELGLRAAGTERGPSGGRVWRRCGERSRARLRRSSRS